MDFIHSECGGLIDTKSRTCTKCKKHWNWLTFMFTAKEIRPVPARLAKEKPRALRIKPGTTSHSKWADSIPGVSAVASRLPNWPRWVRILVTLAFIGLVVFIITLIFR